MGKNKYIQNDVNQNVKVASIANYKAKVEEKSKRIKEYEEGPQPLPGCTCGEHTDPHQFLTEKQVTKHYLKDRKRYVEGLEDEDPLKIYMTTFNQFMTDAPLTRPNMHTQKDMLEFMKHHFEEGVTFYKNYLAYEKELSDQGRIKAVELQKGFSDFKEYIVIDMIRSYIGEKRSFNSKHAPFARKETEYDPKVDSLDLPINDTEGYIKYMDNHFSERDTAIKSYILIKTAENLNIHINEKLNGYCVSDLSHSILNHQLQNSLQEINKQRSRNRKRDFKIIKEEHEKVKDDCSLEYKAEILINLELRKREIDGRSIDESNFTANNSVKQLIETIGMEKLIGKLSTKELKLLFEQLQLLGE